MKFHPLLLAAVGKGKYHRICLKPDFDAPYTKQTMLEVLSKDSLFSNKLTNLQILVKFDLDKHALGFTCDH